MRDVQIPKGYEPVWDDNRLNPLRAEQSVEGYQQSQRTVTAEVPRQQASVSNSQRIKQPRIVSQAPVKTRPVQFVYASTSSGTAAKAERAPKAVPAVQIFVQVAQFNDAAQARASAQRMARTGVPTRMGKKVRGGTAVQLVLAGPFTSRSNARKAVQAARRAGFANAVVMN